MGGQDNKINSTLHGVLQWAQEQGTRLSAKEPHRAPPVSSETQDSSGFLASQSVPALEGKDSSQALRNRANFFRSDNKAKGLNPEKERNLLRQSLQLDQYHGKELPREINVKRWIEMDLACGRRLVEMDLRGGSFQELAQDITRWDKILQHARRLGVEPEQNLRDQTMLFQGLIQVYRSTDPLSEKHIEIHNALQDAKEEIAHGLGKQMGKRAGLNRTRELLESILNDPEGTLDHWVNPEALQSFVTGIESAEAKFLAAQQTKDSQAQLQTLVESMVAYADLHWEAGTEKSFQALASLLEEIPPARALETYNQLLIRLQDSPLELKEKIQARGEELAFDLPTPSSLQTDQVRRVLAARAFFQITGNPTEAMDLIPSLEASRTQILSRLETAAEGLQDQEKRIQWGSLLLEIDQALLTEENPQAGRQFLQDVSRLRQEIEAASESGIQLRLEAALDLSRSAVFLRSYLEQTAPGPFEAAIQQESTQIQKLFISLGGELVGNPRNGNPAEIQLAQAVQGDIRTILEKAFASPSPELLSQMDSENLAQFVQKSLNAHVLLGESREKTTPQALQHRLQAAAIFAELGLTERVQFSMAPLESFAKTLPEVSQRVALTFNLSSLYQRAGMVEETNRLLAGISQWGTPEATQLAIGMKNLNLGRLDVAKQAFRKIPQNNSAQVLLEQIETIQVQTRGKQSLDLLNLVAGQRIAQLREEGNAQRADHFQKDLDRILPEVHQKLVQGKTDSVYKSLMQAGSSELTAFLFENTAGGALKHYLLKSPGVELSEEDYARTILNLAQGLPEGKFYGPAIEIAKLLEKNPWVASEAKILLKDIPETAELDGIVSGLKNMTLYFAESDRAALESAAMWMIPFGVGRTFAVVGENLFVRALGNVVKTPTVLKVGGFWCARGAEAAGFTLSSMSLRTAFTGHTDHWNWDSFGKEFGAMLVMFRLVHGAGVGMRYAGAHSDQAILRAERALAQAQRSGAGVRQATQKLRLAQTLGAVANSPVTQWAVRINAFTGAEYLNEALGLSEGKAGVSYWMRLAGSAVTDAQMIMAGKAFNALSGGKIQEIESDTHRRYLSHENAKLLKTVAEIGYAPNSLEGRAIYRALQKQRAEGTPLGVVKQAVTAEMKGNGDAIDALLKSSGFRSGTQRDVLKAGLVRLAMHAEVKPEQMWDHAKQGPALKSHMDAYINRLLGPGKLQSAEAQTLRQQMLIDGLSQARDFGRVVEGIQTSRSLNLLELQATLKHAGLNIGYRNGEPNHDAQVLMELVRAHRNISDFSFGEFFRSLSESKHQATSYLARHNIPLWVDAQGGFHFRGESRPLSRGPSVVETMGIRKGRVADPQEAPANEAPTRLPAVPVLAEAPAVLERTGTSAGVLFGGDATYGLGRLIPRDGKVVEFHEQLNIRFNTENHNYEYQQTLEPTPQWKRIEPGQTLTLNDKPFMFLEVRGVPKNSQELSPILDVFAQSTYLLASEGVKQKLHRLQAEGRAVSEIDAQNLSRFHSEEYQDAIRSHDGGNPHRAVGGLMGGVSETFAFVHPHTGQIIRFATRPSRAGEKNRKPLWALERDSQGRDYRWIDRQHPTETEALIRDGIPKDAVIVPMTLNRMTGQISLDIPALRNRGLTPQAIEKMRNLNGTFVQLGGATSSALLSYAHGDARSAVVPEKAADSVTEKTTAAWRPSERKVFDIAAKRNRRAKELQLGVRRLGLEITYEKNRPVRNEDFRVVARLFESLGKVKPDSKILETFSVQRLVELVEGQQVHAANEYLSSYEIPLHFDAKIGRLVEKTVMEIPEAFSEEASNVRTAQISGEYTNPLRRETIRLTPEAKSDMAAFDPRPGTQIQGNFSGQDVARQESIALNSGILPTPRPLNQERPRQPGILTSPDGRDVLHVRFRMGSEQTIDSRLAEGYLGPDFSLKVVLTEGGNYHLMPRGEGTKIERKVISRFETIPEDRGIILRDGDVLRVNGTTWTWIEPQRATGGMIVPGSHLHQRLDVGTLIEFYVSDAGRQTLQAFHTHPEFGPEAQQLSRRLQTLQAKLRSFETLDQAFKGEKGFKLRKQMSHLYEKYERLQASYGKANTPSEQARITQELEQVWNQYQGTKKAYEEGRYERELLAVKEELKAQWNDIWNYFKELKNNEFHDLFKQYQIQTERIEQKLEPLVRTLLRFQFDRHQESHDAAQGPAAVDHWIRFKRPEELMEFVDTKFWVPTEKMATLEVKVGSREEAQRLMERIAGAEEMVTTPLQWNPGETQATTLVTVYHVNGSRHELPVFIQIESSRRQQAG